MKISHEDTKTRRDKEVLSGIVVDCAYKLHRELGPGLLESVYEVVLTNKLKTPQSFVSSCLRVNKRI